MKKVFLMIVIALMTCNLFAQTDSSKGGTYIVIVQKHNNEHVYMNDCGGKGMLSLVDAKGEVLYQGQTDGSAVTISGLDLDPGFYYLTLDNGACTTTKMVQF